MEYRIIVAGSRNFQNYDYLCEKIREEIAKIGDHNIAIISGCARGADSLGSQFAKENNIKLYEFPANWDKFGKFAGFKRNEEMLDFAMQEDCIPILLAFWDGKSNGTKHMIQIAKEAGIYLKIY